MGVTYGVLIGHNSAFLIIIDNFFIHIKIKLICIKYIYSLRLILVDHFI